MHYSTKVGSSFLVRYWRPQPIIVSTFAVQMFASLEQNTYTLIIYAVYVDEVLAIVYHHYNIIHWQQAATILFVILYKRTRKRY